MNLKLEQGGSGAPRAGGEGSVEVSEGQKLDEGSLFSLRSTVGQLLAANSAELKSGQFGQ